MYVLFFSLSLSFPLSFLFFLYLLSRTDLSSNYTIYTFLKIQKHHLTHSYPDSEVRGFRARDGHASLLLRMRRVKVKVRVRVRWR